MACSDVQLALSARMDGDVRPLRDADAAHAGTCPRCAAFERGALRVRRALRFSVVEPVPDLVEAVMTPLREEAGARVVTLPRRPEPEDDDRRVRPEPREGGGRRLLPRLAAAALAGAVVGAAITAGGLLPRPPKQATAGDVPREIAAAAQALEAYAAEFRIVERGWRPEVAARQFDAEVTFKAPEMMSITVQDRTRYPDGFEVRNDHAVRLSTNGLAVTAAPACPPQAAPACAHAFATTSGSVGRPPFDSDSPLLTDVVVPVNALASQGDVAITGGGAFLGRTAVKVEVRAEQAAPLFAAFQSSGSWRPLYPADPVELWLDREAWLPLRFEVRSAGGADRDAWAAANGIAPEPPGALVLSGEVVELVIGDAAAGLADRAAADVPAQLPETAQELSALRRKAATNAYGYAISGDGLRDRGFVDLDRSELRTALGYAPIEPADLAGLEPYRFGTFTGGSVAVLSYAKGLSWVRIHESRTHDADAPFGNIGRLAEQVSLAGGGVGLYEPAGERLGRRLSIHAEGWDVYLETNLPRQDLLRLAGSLPVVGLSPPATWFRRELAGGGVQERVTVFEAGIAFAGMLLPGEPPAGSRLIANDLVTGPTGPSVTSYWRRDGIESAGYALRLHQSLDATLPPPAGTDQLEVLVRGIEGRWSPVRHELEWIQDGVYRSMTAPYLDLEAVLRIAESLEPE